jgi:predicted permease
VRGVLLGSLPYGEPERLVRVYETRTRQGVRDKYSASVPNFADFRGATRTLAGVAAYATASRNLLGVAEPRRLRVVGATANLFRVLAAPPLVGRTFAPGEDADGAPPVVVLSERLWRDDFGGDRAVLGRAISLDGVAHTVVGVMPAAFQFPIASDRADAWVPLPLPATGENQDRTSYWLSIVARLRPGATDADAARELAAIAARIRRDVPQVGDLGALVRPLHDDVVSGVRTALLVLLGAVALVLLVACANVANLSLARAESRRREVAVRLALGAERGRLVRQFLTESVVLSGAGGALGLLLAVVGLRLMLALAGPSLPRADVVGLDRGVLLFAVALSTLTGLAFGIVPALRGTRTEPGRDLGGSAGRASASRAQRRVLGALVVGEIALSFTLLVGAGLLLRSFVAVLATDAGLDARDVLSFHTSAPSDRYAADAKYALFYGPVLERLRAVPGVRRAAMTNMLPLQRWGMNGTIRIEGRADADPAHAPFAEFRVVSDGYFATLGIPVRLGREFAASDDARTPHVVLINEAFARRYFPGERPIGRRLFAWESAPSTIVGVVRDVRQEGLDRDARPEVYVAAAQSSRRLYDVTYVVAATGDPLRLAGPARAAVRAVAADQPIYDVKSMQRIVDDSLGARRLTLVLLSLFAALALALSAAGTYGVVSYGVTRRTHEIGIRIALGARRATVGRMVVGDAVSLTLAGVAIGAAAAAMLTRVLQSILYGVGARDPVTFLGVGGTLVVVAVLAGLVPALRAVRVAPSQALRDG